MKKLGIILIILHFTCYSHAQRWPADKANEWYKKQSWLVGCNYIPANAINQLEMWQEETFDPSAIDKELGMAENIGFNFARVFLHNLVWEKDPHAFKNRINTFLDICQKHKIRVMFVFFDDCWYGNPQLGKQNEPVPGLHNSGWVQSPGYAQVTDTTIRPILEKYVKDIIGSYANDSRVILWDLYNEPGNSEHFSETLPLLKKVFQWARTVNPSQPLTAGVWQLGKPEFRELTNFQLQNSDVISFHNYGKFEDMKKDIAKMKSFGRPVICSEYLARGFNSKFETHLPLLKKEDVGAVNWGFIYGKTQTVFPWDTPMNSEEPKIWHHDIFRKDGTPFSSGEIELIKKLTGKK